MQNIAIYLLFNFQERLKIAREFGDRSAERRAHSNLGNANIFLGEFETAAEHYKQTLLLAQVLIWLLLARIRSILDLDFVDFKDADFRLQMW